MKPVPDEFATFDRAHRVRLVNGLYLVEADFGGCTMHCELDPALRECRMIRFAYGKGWDAAMIAAGGKNGGER